MTSNSFKPGSIIPINPFDSGLSQLSGDQGNGRHWDTQQAFYNDPAALANQARQAQFNALAQQIARQSAQYLALAGPEPKPLENTGVEIGEIIAWRVWKVRKNRLFSMTNNTEWAPGEVVEAHTVGPIMGDGIHAFKSRLDAVEYGNPKCVVGRVALWGDVIEFTKGWHAEFAKVHSLDFYLGFDMRQLCFWSTPLKKLCKIYGLPLDRQDLP